MATLAGRQCCLGGSGCHGGSLKRTPDRGTSCFNSHGMPQFQVNALRLMVQQSGLVACRPKGPRLDVQGLALRLKVLGDGGSSHVSKAVRRRIHPEFNTLLRHLGSLFSRHRLACR